MRELHIQIPSFKTLNIIALTIIISLFVYGIIIVKSINEEAKAREIAGKFQQFRYATLSFNNIYSGLPGDISNATFYWREATIDGNGNKKIDANTDEVVTAWQQLQLSKVIEFPYELTGKWDEKLGKNILIPAVNIPQIKTKTTGFFVKYSDEQKENIFGLARLNKKTNNLDRAALTPKEAYNIDLMIDDGYPDKGSLIAIATKDNGCFIAVAGEYKKESEIRECILQFKL
jgi:hypothetical protein